MGFASRKKIKLRTIHYFIADKGPLNGVFSLRILKSDKKIENNRMYRMKDFTDLHKEPIIVRAEKRGWNKVSVSALNISVVRGPFVILFSALYRGAHLKWAADRRDTVYNYYGSCLGYYERVRLPQIKACIYAKGVFSVLQDGAKGFIPAIILEGVKL